MRQQVSFGSLLGGRSSLFGEFRLPRASHSEFRATAALVETAMNASAVTLTVGGEPLVTAKGVFRSFYAISLRIGSEVVGTLKVLDRRERVFTDQDRRILEGFARFLAEQIDLKARAQTDPVTGTISRLAFSDALVRYHARNRRGGVPVALVLLRLRGVQALRDNWGHEVGDSALRVVSEAIRGRIQDADTLGRVGDDVFALLLDHVHPGQASDLANSLCSEIGSLCMTGLGDLGLTADCAVAGAARTLRTPADWVACASRQLAPEEGAPGSGRDATVSRRSLKRCDVPLRLHGEENNQ